MGIFLGTLGDDTINGSSGIDVVTALTGNDTVFGRDGADIIDGGDGDDVLYANSQSIWADSDLDTISAGFGDDRVYAGYGDIVNGGFGFDRLSLDMSTAGSGITADFRAMTLLDLGGLLTLDIDGTQLSGFEAIDNLVGSAFNDRLTLGNRDHTGTVVDAGAGNDLVRASNGADVLSGETGNDRLLGRGGADTLNGGDGDDKLFGGRQQDTLTGGTGKDQFVFVEGDTASSRNRADVITDFSHAQGDRIVLRDIDAVAGGDDDRFAFIGNRAFSNTAGELRFAQVGGDTFVSGDTNGDGQADFTIHLEGTVTLVGSDFAL